MTFPNDPQNRPGAHGSRPDPRSGVRIGNKEREEAMDLLSKHLEAGRLDISEYDDRCRHIANARVHGELSQVFLDLPRIPRDNQEQPSQALAVPGYGRQIYTAEEVAAAAGRGRNIRGGIMALSVVTAFMLVTVLDWFLWIIPVVAILLYMLKIGPSSWYMPTNRQIQREQRQALRQQRQALRQQRLQRRIDGH